MRTHTLSTIGPPSLAHAGPWDLCKRGGTDTVPGSPIPMQDLAQGELRSEVHEGTGVAGKQPQPPLPAPGSSASFGQRSLEATQDCKCAQGGLVGAGD